MNAMFQGYGQAAGTLNDEMSDSDLRGNAEALQTRYLDQGVPSTSAVRSGP